MDICTNESDLKKRKVPLPTAEELVWRHDGMTRCLNIAVHRIQERVIALMVQAGYTEMRLAYVNLTRNLDIEGNTITELANRSAMTKQAMGELVDHCEKINIVTRVSSPTDRRVWIIKFTDRGLIWLEDLRNAVATGEAEMIETIGQPAFSALAEWLRAYNSADLPEINTKV